MKRTLLSTLTILLGSISMMAQSVESQHSDTIVSLKGASIFSNCFKNIDTNGDGIVDAKEAAATTILILDKGGRSNIIYNYDFLEHFPNLTALSVGNTDAECIDLHHQGKLEKLNLTNALFLQKIILADGCEPEITYPSGKTSIEKQYYVNGETIRNLKEEYKYCEKIEQDGTVCYIVGKKHGAYGIWRNGRLEVPCKYSIEELKSQYFTVVQPEAIAKNNVAFKDEAIKEFCLRSKQIDTDNDGEISIDEAKAATHLSFMVLKSFIRNIKSYKDLQYFPNLEYLHAGFTYEETIDVSFCPKLKELDLSDCRMLKTIILAKGCKPEIKYPVANKGEKAKVVYKK